MRSIGTIVLTGFLASLVLPGAARAQLQYFGYVGSAYTTPNIDQGLEDSKSFTNFTHLATSALVQDDLQNRVQAAAQRGLKVTIDLGKLLWCPEPGTTDDYRHLCSNYQSRWNAWVQYNLSILTSSRVVAFAILDEPFLRQADMIQYEAAAALVKGTFSWAKIWMIEAACTVR